MDVQVRAKNSSDPPSLPPPVAVPLTVLPEHECSYLPGQRAVSRAFLAGRMPGEVYHRFMDAGFRRSGRVVYQPACPGCRECRSLRVPVERFRPSKSQRRSWRRNQDLSIAVDEAVPTDEKFELYARYVTQWHSKTDGDHGRETFESFLYDSPVETIEFCYRDGSGRLLGVGICDVCSESLSSVYFYFDPEAAPRGLGTFGALHEIDFARARSIAHYYLGYWVSGCGAMQYKAKFRPCEILGDDGQWQPLAGGI